MSASVASFLFLGGFVAVVIAGAFFYQKTRSLKERFGKQQAELAVRESKMNQRMYELAILKELGERVGYSLDIHQIADMITGSLHQFIEYSAVSYMLIEPEKILFKVHLEKSVHRAFIDEVRDRMLKSLSALLDKEFKKERVEEVLSGAVLIDELSEPVRSFFNIPLVIEDKVVGVLTVSHTIGGLYKEEEMTILYKITSQASKAITKLHEVVKTEQGKLNAMVESMADGVVMTDRDYRVMVVNPAAKNAVGLKDKKDVVIFDFIDKLGGKFDIRGRLEESVKLNKSYASEKFLLNDRFFQIFVFPVINKSTISEGEMLGGVVIFHDVTHEKEIERIRDDFTSMIVHELRSPLDGIKKISELLRSAAVELNVKNREEYLQMIYQNSSRMLELVNDILDLAKLEAGKFEIHIEQVKIRDIIENRVKFYELSAKDSGIKLRALYSAELPDMAKFDPRGIHQVLNNLLSNALKFTKADGEVVVLAFLHKKGRPIASEFSLPGVKLPAVPAEDAFKEYPDAIVIAVSDTGAGISAESIGQLFSKFRQLDTTYTAGEKKGTGLGLAIARGIIEAHKGVINVVSKESAGSVFYFVIPLE